MVFVLLNVVTISKPILLMLLHWGHSLVKDVIKSFSGPRGVNGVDGLIDYSPISREIASLTAHSHTCWRSDPIVGHLRNQESVIGHPWWILEEALGSCMTEMSV